MNVKFGKNFKKLLNGDVERYCRASNEIRLLSTAELMRDEDVYDFYATNIKRILSKYYPELMETHDIILNELGYGRKLTYLLSLTKKRIV